jgi:glycopeptide antibiotics resistance protein
MPHVKQLAPVLGLYIPLLIVGLLLPRKVSVELNKESMNLIKRIFHEILFVSGPLEIFANFLLFIPFFFALVFLAPGLLNCRAALASCLTSGGAEMAQSQIPGRVSSIRDFASNCLGVVIALIVVTAISKGKAY